LPTEAEFCAWLDPHWPAMRRVALRLASPGDGEDVLQNAVLAAWKHRRRFDPARGSAASWLTTITANEARKSHRGRRRMEPLSDTAGDITEVVSLDLQRAISSLPARQAMAVNLFYYADLPLRETAAAMGCAEGTVKSTLSAARAALRAILQEERHD
jgi:RNA polymerase sigma factor (sigma-70 family)